MGVRPNQLPGIFAESIRLGRAYWEAGSEKPWGGKLLTPIPGCVSMSVSRGLFLKAKYVGDLRGPRRAYHQGTGGAWLIGPFIDALRKVYPKDRRTRGNFSPV